MSATTLVHTSETDTPPLLPGGTRLYDRYAQIRAVPLRRLEDSHVHLLAEPRPDGSDGRFAWFTAASGIVRPLSALPGAVRDSVRAECDALLAQIRALGETLENGAAGDGRTAGKLLRLAASRSSDDQVFLVGNQPVLIGWGRDHTDVAGPSSPGPVGTPSAPPPPPANANARWLLPVEDVVMVA